MFKQHLEMIGRNETPSKKAKFWQSYVRSLKGSEDIRAHETPKARAYRPFSTAYDSLPAHLRSIYDEAAAPAERIQGTGYRYLPVHRETYGYSPRAIYDHHYSRTIPANYDVERAWNEHLKRMQEIERRYPSRYGLYLKDKPSAQVPLEYEPEDKPHYSDRARSPTPSVMPIYRARSGSPFSHGLSVPPRTARAISPGLEPLQPIAPVRASSELPYRASSVGPYRSPSIAPYRASSLEPLDRIYSKLNDFPMRHYEREGSPTPVKAGRWGPRPTEIAFDSEGLPIFHPRNRYNDIFNPRPSLPISAITRDPFWWDMEDLAPFMPRIPYWRQGPLVRDSFLSPVRRNYLWTRHPLRPYAHN